MPSSRNWRGCAARLLILGFSLTTASAEGIWIGPQELAALPTSGPAWDNVKDEADASWEGADLDDYSGDHDVQTLAGALVAARLGLDGAGASYRAKVADGLMEMIGTDGGDSSTAEARNITSYVLAADLIDFESYRPADELTFRSFISDFRFECWGGEGLYDHALERANNKGTMAVAAYLAISIYLRDHGLPAGSCQNVSVCDSNLDEAEAEAACQDPAGQVAMMANVFKGWLGDRSAYDGFDFKSPYSWHCDEDAMVGINPQGCTKNGHNIDGVLPDDQRRAGGFTWPPPKENYVYTGLQGVVAAAILLHRQGYPAFDWEDQAIKRTFDWLHTPHFEPGDETFPAEGNDECLPHVANHFYGTSYPAELPARPAKNFGWTDWTLAGDGPAPCPACANGVEDCNETGVDCGGSCGPCVQPDPPPAPTNLEVE